MEIRAAQSEDHEGIRQFLAEAGWSERVSDSERFRRMMERTQRAVVALDGTRIIGFARALCDGESNGYISMVAVAVDWRGRGVGRRLIEHLTGEADDDDEGDGNGGGGGRITWVLRAGRGSAGFWEKLGFKASEVTMEKVRRRTN